MGILTRDKGVGKRVVDSLTQQEAKFLLKTVHDCRFDGKDVFLLADVVNKLQRIIES